MFIRITRIIRIARIVDTNYTSGRITRMGVVGIRVLWLFQIFSAVDTITNHPDQDGEENGKNCK